MKEITSRSIEETKGIAKMFIDSLKGGEVVELIGDLGSGKTAFVRSVVEVLGSTARVKSPTFTVMNEYPVFGEKIKRIVHLDLYRFDDPEELGALHVEDYKRPDTVIFVEWPNVFNVPLFEEAKRIEFTFIDEETRKIVFQD